MQGRSGGWSVPESHIVCRSCAETPDQVVDGEISCTVAQDPYNMGYQCVKSLLDVVEGEKLDDFIDTGCKVITPDNAQEYLDKLKSLV